MKEVIAKLERILELTSTHGITIQPEGEPATSDDQLMYVGSKIRLNAIQALDIFDKNNIEKQKPRTKAEFVRCEFEQVYLAAKAVFDGEELFVGFIDHSGEPTGEYSEAVDQQRAARNYQHLYRKVETEIDERQEFIDTAAELLNQNSHDNEANHYKEWFGAMFESGKFKLVE